MAHTPERRSLFTRGDASPSFARTGSELTLDDSDEDDDDDDDYDLRSEVGGSETYEMIAGGGSRGGGGGGRDDDDGRTRRADEESRRRPSSSSTAASFELYTPDEEVAVRRKFDRKLVLFVALLFMLSFLDRS
ncbi:hypothetical protein E4U55_001654, partial [Claviceps digitariae]